MSVLRSSRDRFDADVSDDLNVVLILAGSAASQAQLVHDEAVRLQHSFRKTWILRNVDVLDADEQELWVNAPDQYAFYNVDKATTSDWGSVGELADSDGVPDLFLIRKKFAESELA